MSRTSLPTLLLAFCATTPSWAQTWDDLGGSGTGNGLSASPAMDSADCSIILDPQGFPIVAWAEKVPGSTFDIYVLHWTGSAWTSYGPGANVSLTPTADSLSPVLSIHAGGDPVVAWSEEVPSLLGPNFRIYVKRWNSTTRAWMAYGSSAGGSGLGGSSFADSKAPSIAMGPAGQPVVAWSEDLDGDPTTLPDKEIYLRRWAGGTLGWVELDGSATGAGLSGTPDHESAAASVAIDRLGNPVVAWAEDQDGDPMTLDKDVHVRRWDGAAWREYGSPAGLNITNTPDNSRFPTLAFNGAGDPVVAWNEAAGAAGELRVVRWDGLAWTGYGSSAAPGGISGGNAALVTHSLAFDEVGDPVVAWTDGEVRLRRWNGAAWAEVGGSITGNGVSVGSDNGSKNPSLAIDGQGNLVVAWEGYLTSASQREIYLRRWLRQAPTLGAFGQFRLDGATPIPPGEPTYDEEGFVAAATVIDADGDETWIEVEFKVVGVAFDGVDTRTSTAVPAGATATFTITGLTFGTGYHWRLRALGAQSMSSAWTSFGSDPDDPDEVDLKPTINYAPDPVDPVQVDPATGLVLATGERFLSSGTLSIEGRVGDVNDHPVRIEVELQRVGDPFTDQATASSPWTPVGTVAVVTLPIAMGAQRWQFRAVDQHGGATTWTSYGGNAESEPDFVSIANGSVGSAGCLGSAAAALALAPFLGLVLLLRR